MAAERPIAEILGWRPVDLPYNRWQKPDGAFTALDPDVDDMLAWIERQGVDWEIEPDTDENLNPIRVVTINVAPAEYLYPSAPTLREALERAVRAVAGEEITDA